MSGKVVSLSKMRKQKARDAARSAADANAVKFGRTKAQKSLDRAARDKAAKDLDGQKRE